MSDRSISEVLSILKGKTYSHYLYDVAHLAPNAAVDESLVLSITAKLREFGFDEWRNEE